MPQSDRVLLNVLSDDYNSWQETPQSETFKDRLDTEVIVFEGTLSPASLTTMI